MNICFVILRAGAKTLADEFGAMAFAAECGCQTANHRLVGGFRASCYNARQSSVEALVACMRSSPRNTRNSMLCPTIVPLMREGSGREQDVILRH